MPPEFGRATSAGAPQQQHAVWSDPGSVSSTQSTSLSSSATSFMQPRKNSDITSSDHSVSLDSRPSPPLPPALPQKSYGSGLAIAPRSSSLPFASMGHSYSKSAPAPLASSSPSPAPKTINTPVPGGSRLKRAFAGRRKKSEDVSTVVANGPEAWPILPDAQRVEPIPSSPSSTQVIHPPSPQTAHFRGAKKLTQLATQAFTKMGPKSQAPLSPPPPPPPKPTPRSQPNVSITSLRQSLPSDAGSAPSTANRSSIIPISPGISSAVNYMRMGELEREKEKEAGSEDTDKEKEKEKEKVKDEQKVEFEQPNKGEMKDVWRKSDSTIGRHTIRPGATTANCTSRPVSVADSFQSSHTIVPSNKRFSALITDTDYGILREDEDESPKASIRPLPTKSNVSPTSSLRTKNRRSMSLNFDASTFLKPQTPLLSSTAAPIDYKLPSHSISEGVAPFTAAAPTRETAALTRTGAYGFISPSYDSPQSAGNVRGQLAAWTLSSQSYAQQERTLPALPNESHRLPSSAQSLHPVPLIRQTAISMSNGLAPAAGLAKRTMKKMGRAWGMSSSSSSSGYSTSSSSIAAPSSFTSASHTDHNLTRTISNQSNPSINNPLQYRRRTPNHNKSSGTHSVSPSIASGPPSDSDPFTPSPGPVLGKMMRGPLKNKLGATATGKVVFGRELKAVVKETRVWLGQPGKEESEEPMGRVERGISLKALEARMVPALVARCAQHLLIWGVQEEGLFRLSGRPSHVTKLRSEFDSGADYDMMECAPGDLDPHAVASVFKAYLRELPEPILTHALLPYFDAAITQETTINANTPDEPSPSRGHTRSPGLPVNIKTGGFSLPSIRKPPSLSTLAMPSFTGIRPPSHSLIKALRSLISQLPAENRDLIRTVVELIKTTAKEFKETKMPLSNLLLVFCPSLNMNPSLLRVLCEDVLWSAEYNSPVMDIKRESIVLDISASRSTSTFDGDEDEEEFSDAQDRMDGDSLNSVGRTPESSMSSDYHGSAEGSLIMEDVDPQRRWTVVSRPEIPTVYLDSKSRCSSVQDDNSLSDGYSAASPQLVSSPSSPAPLSSSAESVATPFSSGRPSLADLPLARKQDSSSTTKVEYSLTGSPKIVEALPLPLQSKRPFISSPISPSGSIQFPSSPSQEHPSPTKRRSIPILSLPSFSNHSNRSDPPSPASISSTRGLRSKKPSLRLLFSKRSSSSLAGLSPNESRPFISGPLPHDGLSPYLEGQRAVSESSVSTPLSAVTASQGSSSDLPPTLDTPIEGPSFGLNFDISPLPTPAQTSFGVKDGGDYNSPSVTSVSQTPIADWYRSPSAAKSRQPLAHKGLSNSQLHAMQSSSSFDDNEHEEDWSQNVMSVADHEGRRSVQRPGRA